ncbi:hypothetical protein IPM65_04630 [Candidatus Roizmanbacteria bacterium]|nr:MAG: hypothetical protein IPM65_04630 [Candidatus Roizmanbacteria bacterium]
MTEIPVGQEPQVPQSEPRVFDVSKDLYEGGKADIYQLAEYVKVARTKKVFDSKSLDLTGGTLMDIYMGVAAEAGKPGSKVKEFAFNNPGREGRVVLWSDEFAADIPDHPTKPLLAEVPPSKLDPNAPTDVVDLRLTFADNPEAMQQMADPTKAQEYMREVAAQLKELKARGVNTVRMTGIPMWLSQGAAFAATRLGMDRVISYTLAKEVVVYDGTGEMMGKIESKTPEDVEVDLAGKEITDMEAVRSGRALQETLGVEVGRNKIDLKNVDLSKIPPHVALRMFDSFHSYSSSLKLGDVEVFQHLDFRTHDLVPKTTQRNPDLLPRDQRTSVTQDVHAALEAADGDPEKAALTLATEAVNNARELTFTGVTNPQELAVAGKVAHAAHGLIEELSYKESPDAQPQVVKSWKAQSQTPSA